MQLRNSPDGENVCPAMCFDKYDGSDELIDGQKSECREKRYLSRSIFQTGVHGALSVSFDMREPPLAGGVGLSTSVAFLVARLSATREASLPSTSRSFA